jgi:serine/threonine-protein kinase RsbW
VHITITILGKSLNIKVYDQGQGFDICSLPSPDFKNLDEHGRGVYIIRSLMDRVTYRKVKSGHVLEMIKTLH